MRHPDTVYRGRRHADGTISVTVTMPAPAFRTFPLTPRLSLRIHPYAYGFEWGYRGAGPHQLAIALVLDATADERVARLYSIGFMLAEVDCWVRDTWSITAGEIQATVDRLADDESWAVLVAEGGAA